MTYPIHPNNREGYNSSHKSWLRTDLPTSTPVSGFEDPAYPPDPSLSADTALWPLPELMMQPAFFFSDGGKLATSNFGYEKRALTLRNRWLTVRRLSIL